MTALLETTSRPRQNNDPNLEALLAQGYSQADIDMMLANGIDPYQQVAEYAADPVYDPAEAQSIAQQNLVDAETRALQQAAAQTENSNTSTFVAAKEAIRDKDVQDARKEVETIFTPEATRIKTTAMALAIENSSLPPVNKNKIAIAAAGYSPTELLKGETSDASTIENYAGLKDKVNGRANKTIERIAEQTRDDLKRFGLAGASIKKLGNEALRTAGADLTKTDVAIAAEETAIGEQVVGSLSGGKPKMTKELRDKVKELENKGQLKKLLQAVANKNRSRGTLQQVGKQMRRTMRNTKVA